MVLKQSNIGNLKPLSGARIIVKIIMLLLHVLFACLNKYTTISFRRGRCAHYFQTGEVKIARCGLIWPLVAIVLKETTITLE